MQVIILGLDGFQSSSLAISSMCHRCARVCALPFRDKDKRQAEDQPAVPLARESSSRKAFRWRNFLPYVNSQTHTNNSKRGKYFPFHCFFFRFSFIYRNFEIFIYILERRGSLLPLSLGLSLARSHQRPTQICL